MVTAIESRSLTKCYDGNKVVNNLTFQVPEGSCFGIVGPIGAGKTTALRMHYCATLPTSGELFVLGLNVRENQSIVKSKIGVMPQESGLDLDFSVLDNLIIYSRFHRIPKRRALTRARELLRFVHLEEFDHRNVDQLGFSMQRRLTMARALINDPSLVILDSPTEGLDEQSKEWIWEAIGHLKSKGCTILLGTANMMEAERFCDQIAILDKGKFLAMDRPKDLIRKHIGSEVVEFNVTASDLEYYIKKIRGQYSYQILNNRIHLFVGKGQDGRGVLNLISSDSIRIRRSSLHDVFLKLAGYNMERLQ